MARVKKKLFACDDLVDFWRPEDKVLGARQSDVREGASLSQADLSTFRFDVFHLLITFS